MDQKVRELYKISYELRQKAVEMVNHAKTGHIAPSLSMAEMVATLYFDILNVDPANPHWQDRDRFVLSKGHACPLYYAALAKRGFFPEEDLMQYRMLASKLQGHPDMRKCPGVDMTTGSLGNGVSAALGMALIGKKDHRNHWVYAIAGDGEIQEGIVWEAALYAGNAKLDNLILFIDNNGLQSGGSVASIQDLGDLEARFCDFKWDTQVIDGHDIEAIRRAVETAKQRKGTPSVIIAKTTKGKGVSFMENQYLWHMKAPNAEEYRTAMEELGKAVEQYA
ncbi:transketolase [Anaerotruncus rubiinfantis]|uniref:transketolase n=1 Tax=Anaerotruncus rubiinfantis TaxID=1720200 RepID=UPI001899B56C|nr:transketolase [Anaerotruncus rubiinfantis]